MGSKTKGGGMGASRGRATGRLLVARAREHEVEKVLVAARRRTMVLTLSLCEAQSKCMALRFHGARMCACATPPVLGSDAHNAIFFATLTATLQLNVLAANIASRVHGTTQFSGSILLESRVESSPRIPT